MEKLYAESLANQAYAQIESMVRKMSPANNKLPSEDELAQMMGVSRPTIREALKRLTRYGYITSSHGRGTYGHPAVFNVKNRIDLHTNFSELLESQYKDVKVDVENLGIVDSSESYSKYTGHAPEQVYSTIWRYSADGMPMIHGSFEFPLHIFHTLPDPKDSVHDLKLFSIKYLFQPIAYVSMTLRCKKYAPAARWLDLPEDTAMLSWKEIIWNIEDFPVGFARFYVHPDNLQMSVVAHFK